MDMLMEGSACTSAGIAAFKTRAERDVDFSTGFKALTQLCYANIAHDNEEIAGNAVMQWKKTKNCAKRFIGVE